MTSNIDTKQDTLPKKDDNVALLEARVENVMGENAKVSFLTSDDEEARIRMALDRGVFIGFTKEELLKFERDPSWGRLRVVLLILFWISWALLLVAAIVVIVRAPQCPSRPELEWSENYPIYEIYVPSFRIGKKCSGDEPKNGNIEGIYDVLADKDFYYFDRLYPAKTLWLRGISEIRNRDDNPEIYAKLEKLFTFAKKMQRRILLEITPFKEGDRKAGNTLKELECGIFSGSTVAAADTEVNFDCINEDDLDKMIEFVNKYRNVANGFVLDYSEWLLSDASSATEKSPLAQLVDAVTVGKSKSDAKSGDNSKHLFMRFPVLDKRFVSGGDKETLINKRIKEEAIAREAGVRVIIETLSINPNDINSCSSIECLVQLITTVQSFVNVTQSNSEGRDEKYRAFAIDDPELGYRTDPGSELVSAEALAAFHIAGLPGTPVVYYGSEIGMASDSKATDQMIWTNRNNNTCDDFNSVMCFCNKKCMSNENVLANRTCPSLEGDLHHASVREQIRTQSSGPLASFVELLKIRHDNDSLSWGNSTMMMDQPTEKSQTIFMAIRKARSFDRFGLFISLGADSRDPEAVPHLPPDIENSCYQTVYSNNGGSNKLQEEFSHMILKPMEVRLVRIFNVCNLASASSATSWLLLLAMFIHFMRGN